MFWDTHDHDIISIVSDLRFVVKVNQLAEPILRIEFRSGARKKKEFSLLCHDSTEGVYGSYISSIEGEERYKLM